MTPIVLIGMPEDDQRLRQVVEALHEAKVDLWWERAEPGSRDWAKAADAMMQARAIVFFWSTASLADTPAADAYRLFARRAMTADKAISAKLEKVSPPEAFTGSTIIDLSRWRGGGKDLFLLDLVAAANAKAAGLDPPPARGPARRLFRRIAIIAPVVLAALSLLATLIGFYDAFGLSKIAGPAEAKAWQAVRPGSCQDLRQFLENHTDGVHASEARTLLEARKSWTETDWRPTEKPLPLYLTRGSAAAQPNEAAARAFAAERAEVQARAECGAYAQAGSFRLKGMRVVPREWLCEPLGGGTVCGIEGQSICLLDEQVEVARESCGAAKR